MNPQVFVCRSCQQPFQVLPQQAGRLVKCPTCDQAAEIPAFVSPPPSVPNSEAPSEEPPIQPELIFNCTHCQLPFGVTRQMFGTRVACPHCRQIVEIEDPEFPSQPIEIAVRKKPPKPKSAPLRDAEIPKQPEETSTATFVPRKEKDNNQSPGANPEDQAKRPKRKQKSAANQAAPKSNQQPVSDSNRKTLTNGNKAVASKPAPKSIDHLLPPETESLIRQSANANNQHAAGESDTTSNQGNMAAAALPTGGQASEPQPIDHLLPPRFDVFDHTLIRISRPSDFKVLLPDGSGGVKQIDKRIVTLEHNGQQVSLTALTPQERSRRRMITNSIAILLGIVILAVAFSMLT